MTVAIRATGSTRRVRSKKSETAASSPKVTPLEPRKPRTVASTSGDQTVKALGSAAIAPNWVRSLLKLQHSSCAIAVLLTGACLSVYGWTVYSQQLWNVESRKLETLRRAEQQLATANEILKHQMAQQAEMPGTGLVPPDPKRIIFLEPAPARPPVPSRNNLKPAASSEQAVPKPLGY